MRNLTKLACCGSALALMLVVTDGAMAGKPGGGPKPVMQACTLSSDADGGGTVGITAWSSGPLTMTNISGELADVFGTLSSNQTGLGRVLKKQGRLDFWFDPDNAECRPIEWGEVPPYDPDVCRYELLLLNGVYNSKRDTVSFGPGTEALLYDFVLGDQVGSGTATLLVTFLK